MQNLLKKKSASTPAASPPPLPEPKKNVDIIAQKYLLSKKSEQKSVEKKTEHPKTVTPTATLAMRQRYKAHLPLLFFAAVFYFFTAYIFFFIQPSAIQNVFFPNSYAPLFFCTCCGDFFFFSYLFLNARRGLFVSIIFNYGLFLKLQGVFSWMFFLPAVVPFLLIELILTVGKQKGRTQISSYASFGNKNSG